MLFDVDFATAVLLPVSPEPTSSVATSEVRQYGADDWLRSSRSVIPRGGAMVVLAFAANKPRRYAPSAGAKTSDARIDVLSPVVVPDEVTTGFAGATAVKVRISPFTVCVRLKRKVQLVDSVDRALRTKIAFRQRVVDDVATNEIPAFRSDDACLHDSAHFDRRHHDIAWLCAVGPFENDGVAIDGPARHRPHVSTRLSRCCARRRIGCRGSGRPRGRRRIHRPRPRRTRERLFRGLGGLSWLGRTRAATEPPRDGAQPGQGQHLDGQPGPVGSQTARGQVVETKASFRSRMTFSISAWSRWSASNSSVSRSPSVSQMSSPDRWSRARCRGSAPAALASAPSSQHDRGRGASAG